MGAAPLRSLPNATTSEATATAHAKTNMPRSAATPASINTNEAQTMNVDQDPSSDSFVNGGVSTRRSSSGTPTAATGGANNGGPPTAARTGRNVTGLTTDKGHNAAARATTTTTTRSTAENDNNRQDAAPLQQGGSARNAVQSRQRVREVAAAPRVLRPRTGGAASAGSPETGRQAKAGGASIPAGARESSRKRDAPAADAAPSGKPNKKRQKASQPKQPEIRDSADSSCTALDGADELGVRQEPAPRQLKATAPPASNEANWDDSSLPDAEVQEPVPPQSPTSPAGQQDAPLDDGASSAPRADASASPTDNRLDEARSHHTQDGALSHEKIACVYHIPHQEEPTTQAREGATPTPSETIQFIVDVLGDKRAEKFLTKRAFRSADDSCVGNAGNRIEVKIGEKNCTAFVALLNLCGQTWLETHGNVTGEWVAKQLRDHLDDFVLTKDLVMQALIKKHGQFEGVAYSLLVSYGKVGAQPVHIDCVFPEYMATLTLTPGPKTDIFLVNEEMDIELGEMTCQDFARLICNRSGCRSCKEHEEELALALQDEHIPEMIKHYGYVLSSWECRNRASDKLLKSHPGLADNETGYVGMLGSVCHSGPMFNGLRGVLYGSYNIPGRKGYNGRNQYNSATLLAVIISFLVENEDVKLTLGCMEMLLKLLLEVSKEPYQEDFLDKVTLCSEAACLLEMLTETMVTEKVTTEKKMTVKVRVEKKFEPKEVAEVYEWVVAKREIEGEEGQLRSEAVNEGEEVHERSEAVNKYEELLAAKRKAEEEAKREEEAMRKKEEAKRKKEEAKSKKARRSRK